MSGNKEGKADMITLNIDGAEYRAEKGATILEVARANGIDIPTLCHDERLAPYGGCRLCLVEVEGARGLLPSCTTAAEDGMVVKTSTEQVESARRTSLELLISDHPMACTGCSKSGNCELQKLAKRYGIEESQYKGEKHEYPVLTDNPFILRDYNKCVLCARCIRICREVQGVGVYDFVNRGFAAVPGTPYDRPMTETPCEFCGQCISTCPTGALTARPFEERERVWKREMARSACAHFGVSLDEMMEALGVEGWKVRTTCPYCGCGCQLDLHVLDNRVVEVTSPVMVGPGQGNLCIKGRFGQDFISSPDRLTRPLMRKDGELVETSWEEALQYVAGRLAETVKKTGPDSLAVLASARITNEENYLLQKFMRAVVGTNNIDHCARLCHAPSVAGLARSFGSGAMTNSIEDLEKADAVLIIGSNTTETHPIIALRLKKAVMEHDCKIIVADARRIRMCYFADKWLRQRPGTDVALINGMMNVIIEEGLYDKDFIESRTEGFEELKKAVGAYTPEKVEEITGVEADLIREAARVFATAERAAIVYAMGITQHTTGTDNVMTLANLAMLTGNIGKEGTGVNPLRGQNNVQGSCDMGALPNVFSGYQAVSDPEVSSKFAEAWGVKELPQKPGLTVTEMMEAALKGEIKAMYIVGENPMMSDPDIRHVEEALRSLDLLVVQDIFLTETARLADVVLPAAAYAEKEGTFTNTDRRVQRVRKAVEPPGEARSDLRIIADLSEKMGYPMPAREAHEVFREMASLTPSYAGISHERLDRGETIHWPCPEEGHPGTPILHTEKFVRGKGAFIPAEHKPPVEMPDQQFPLVLTTGRVLQQYHTGTMTRRVAGINQIDPANRVWMSPQDAEGLGVESGDLVKVSTRRGEIEAEARVTRKMPEGLIFVPFHYSESPANALTVGSVDPVAKIPEYKVAAAAVSVVKKRGNGSNGSGEAGEVDEP
jgi:formate dehydrogenase alpha subunit